MPPPAVAASLLGAADAGVFLAGRPRLFTEKPQRAAGSLALTGLWLASARAAAAARPGRGATALAVTLVGGNAGLLAAHLRARIASPRIFAGAALSAVVLTDVLRRR